MNEMITCPKCNAVNENSSHCSQCGHTLSKDNLIYEASNTASDEVRTFIGKNEDYYIDKWNSATNPETFAGWNWAAACFGVFWFAYRKMYQYMFLMIVLTLIAERFISYASVPVMFFIISGLFGNTFYYHHCKQSIAKAKRHLDDTHTNLKRSGGIHLISIILPFLIFVAYGIATDYITPNKASMPSNAKNIDLMEYFPITEKENWRVFRTFSPTGAYIDTFTETTIGVDIHKNGTEVTIEQTTSHNTETTTYLITQNTLRTLNAVPESLLIDLTQPFWTLGKGKTYEFTAEVLSYNETLNTPAGTFKNCLVILGTLTDNNGTERIIEAYAPALGRIYIEYEDGMISTLVNYQ